MSDENQKPTFKAPPMPSKPLQMPSHREDLASTVQANQVEGNAQEDTDSRPEFVENPYADNFAVDLNLPPKVLQTKVIGSIVAGIFFFGLMMGCAMSGGSGKTVVQGLTDVVQNPQVAANPRMRRCGQTDPNRECILYIMNSKNYDRIAEDFFQEAQDMTGVQKYSIQLSNTRYANALIQPGWIAQIYIPARY